MGAWRHARADGGIAAAVAASAFAPLPWLNHKAVAFGRVVKGVGALRAINKLETRNERPVESVSIAGAGVIDLERPLTG